MKHLFCYNPPAWWKAADNSQVKLQKNIKKSESIRVMSWLFMWSLLAPNNILIDTRRNNGGVFEFFGKCCSGQIFLCNCDQKTPCLSECI